MLPNITNHCTKSCSAVF